VCWDKEGEEQEVRVEAARRERKREKEIKSLLRVVTKKVIRRRDYL